MEETSSRVVKKLLIEQFCWIGVSLVAFVLHDYGSPYRRGFFCDDYSIRYPDIRDTIPYWLLIVFVVGIPLLVISGVEFKRWKSSKESESINLFGDVSLPLNLIRTYNKITHFLFGLACTFFFTAVGKLTTGRLRPNFMDVCRPYMPGHYAIDCSHIPTKYNYIENYRCNNADEEVREVRLSFPSGHASASFFAMLYLVFYIQSRTRLNTSFKLLLQVCFILFAFFISLTRVRDNKHHWSDVVAGMVLGVLAATITVKYISDLFKDEKKEDNIDEIETVVVQTKEDVVDYKLQQLQQQPEREPEEDYERNVEVLSKEEKELSSQVQSQV